MQQRCPERSVLHHTSCARVTPLEGATDDNDTTWQYNTLLAGLMRRWALTEVEVVSGIVLKSARKRQAKDDSIKARPVSHLLQTLLSPHTFWLTLFFQSRKHPATSSRTNSSDPSSTPASTSPAPTLPDATTLTTSTRSPSLRSQRTRLRRIDTCWRRMRSWTRRIGRSGRGRRGGIR